MKKTLSIMAFALAATLAAPAIAEEAPAAPKKVEFTHDGVTYTYTKTRVGESTIYKGTATPGSDFYLVERHGRVTGKANGIDVSFGLNDREYLAAYNNRSVRLAAR